MNNLALHWKILIGMLLGVVFGVLMLQFSSGKDLVVDWIKPFGTIFINALKLIAIPLILASLIKGVSDLKDIAKLSKMGGRTVILYMITTVTAVTIGLGIVNIIQPGKIVSKEAQFKLVEAYAEDAASKQIIANKQKEGAPLQALVDIVPSNIFSSASDNGNMLQIIFFAILFSISLIMLPKEKTIYVKGFFDGINDIILQIVDIIMMFAPYGVFSLLSSLVVEYGASGELFAALAIYSLNVILGLMLMILIIYPIVLRSFTKIKYIDFFKAISPAQMLAFSTSSSAATLPVTMERCEEKLNVSKEVSSFVLPLGATINMDGTSLYQAVAAVFIAQAFGYDLDLSAQLTIVLTATLASIGAAAVPGSGMVMLVIVLSAIGINPEGIALIFAVDRILDMLRTVVNVTGDATIATVVSSLNPSKSI
ncbi:MAG: dicarboxylate/amino acid:cation symporter [Gammaproteobacteria bacterium]|nr:dicarboxylate/amino acid:cation symporter [Gammaproteobacteria bacterium]